MTVIEHGVQIFDGTYANTVGPVGAIEEKYPVGMTDPTQAYVGEPKLDPVSGAEIIPINSALRFKDLPDGRRAIQGNTVVRLCPVAPDCGSCALRASGLSVPEMAEQNCARANTTVAFEQGGQDDPRGRFVLLPTSKKAFVVGEGSSTPEYNGDGELLHNRLQSGYSAVFTESWLRDDQGLTEVAIGAHGADGSVGVATVVVEGETIYVPFFSLRQNMGDRAPEDQILRQALNAYYDSQGYDDARRTEINSQLEVSITLAASASLKNFAHQVQLPAAGSDKAKEIGDAQADLVERAGGRITTAIVLNHEYAGAMLRGNVWPAFEAKADGRAPNPISPDNCPGDGQNCHVDYRAETEYALVGQLEDMGVPRANIHYDDTNVMDPGDSSNNAASNRAEQNSDNPDYRINGKKTNRTLNALRIKLPERSAA